MLRTPSFVRMTMAAGLVLMSFATALHAAAQAETPSEFVATLGDSAIRMLVEEGVSPDKRIANFRELLLEGFDVPLIGRFVLGIHWRRASPEQRTEYTDLFEKFLVQSYAARLGQYGGESLRVKATRAGGEKDTIVSTEILQRGRPPVKVDWRVRSGDASYKVVDVIVEGISMIITQRDEFSSVIRRSGGSVEGLLARLRERAD
ncbi:MAG: ABC transporter substrate-binding protein [Proteobacteria bacterium]|nr:ABC transporter substrate-binding protein [Pseudomonadota bacterium]